MFSTLHRFDIEKNPVLYLDYKNSKWLWDVIPFAIMFMYLAFVLRIGPKIMEKRKPLDIKSLIVLYNVFQVICNIFLCEKILRYVINNVKFNEIHCIKQERHDSLLLVEVREMEFLFFLNKGTDLIDTIFFVLRKKQSHLSFFHLYHHTMIFIMSWFAFRILNGGIALSFGILNTFIHMIMYTYYLLSVNSLTSKIGSFMKKPLTQMQIGQFLLLGMLVISFLLDPNCEEKHSVQIYFSYFGSLQVVIMISMFTNFYRKTYKNKN